jgi:hypothetical protein
MDTSTCLRMVCKELVQASSESWVVCHDLKTTISSNFQLNITHECFHGQHEGVCDVRYRISTLWTLLFDEDPPFKIALDPSAELARLRTLLFDLDSSFLQGSSLDSSKLRAF